MIVAPLASTNREAHGRSGRGCDTVRIGHATPCMDASQPAVEPNTGLDRALGASFPWVPSSLTAPHLPARSHSARLATAPAGHPVSSSIGSPVFPSRSFVPVATPPTGVFSSDVRV